jgi:hypothetical protein
LVRWGESSLVLNEVSSVNKTCHNRFGTICMGTLTLAEQDRLLADPNPSTFATARSRGAAPAPSTPTPGVSSASSAWGSWWWRWGRAAGGAPGLPHLGAGGPSPPPSTSRPWTTPPST